MPPIIKKTAGGSAYAIPFIGRVDHTIAVQVDISVLTTSQVDADGVIKPGVVLPKHGGALANGDKGLMVYAAQKIREGNANLAADTSRPFVTCAVVAVADRYLVERNLDRVLTAAEIAVLAAGKIDLQS